MAVRVSQQGVNAMEVPVTVHTKDGIISIPVKTVSLSELQSIHGPVVITTKSYTNPDLVSSLKDKYTAGPVIILQNGLGVEAPFLAESKFASVCRCVLYVTAQATPERKITFRWVNPSPIGLVRGSEAELAECVQSLNTSMFPFRVEANISREVWRKTIINAVFNSICPLLEVDNGIFARDESIAALGTLIVKECLTLAHTCGIFLTETEILDKIMQISRGSEGVLISTLQDIQNRRPTEIDSINLALSRLAASQTTPIDLRMTDLLGQLILAKSRLSCS